MLISYTSLVIDMQPSNFIRGLYTRCKIHGSGDAQVVISDGELTALTSIAIRDIGWDMGSIGVNPLLPEDQDADYYAIPLSWFETVGQNTVTATDAIAMLDTCFNVHNDFALFIENLSTLHRRRAKYRRILSNQPVPTMNQIGPRALLEFGGCDTDFLVNWMTWRKWIYDIDNRAAQETGYLFEPLLATCLGGEPVGAQNLPVKRLDAEGNQTRNGRQIDCLVPESNRTYELKLRVTIAASGQGRFSEELSFPVESQAAGYTPVLLVLDPTPSNRLTELAAAFKACEGQVYIGDDAWKHMEDEAGEIVSIFVSRYIKPVIKRVEEFELERPCNITLEWANDQITISSENAEYRIQRN